MGGVQAVGDEGFEISHYNLNRRICVTTITPSHPLPYSSVNGTCIARLEVDVTCKSDYLDSKLLV